MKKKRPVSFGTLLTLFFILLKVLGKIDWSWVWVLSPLWIGLLINVSFILGGLAILTMLKKDVEDQKIKIIKNQE